MPFTQIRASDAQLSEKGHLLEGGVVRVAIDSTGHLARASATHQCAAMEGIQRKIVLTNF